MSQNDAESIASQRQGNDYTDTNWARTILQPYGNSLGTLTGAVVSVLGRHRRGERRRAGVSPRSRVVVDVQKTPAKIVYRKDMTSYGWPFPQSLRKQLLAGQAVGVGSVQQAMATGLSSH